MVSPQTNMAIELFCVIQCSLLLLYLYLDRRNTGKENRWLFIMTLACVFMNLGGMTDWIFSGTPGMVPRMILWLGSILFYTSFAVVMTAYIRYLCTHLEHKNIQIPLIIPRLSIILAGIVALATVFSPLTKWIFYITEDNIYRRGILFYPSQILSGLIYVLAIWILVHYRNALSRKEKIFFWAFSLAPLAAQIFQAFHYGIALLSTTITLVLMLVFTFIQSEICLENEVQKRALQQVKLEHMERLRGSQTELTEQIITALSNAVEAKDRYTNGHSRRVAMYSREIVRRMGWDEEQQRRVYYAALLHDVGKIRIMDTIINKTERLTDGEYDEMKLHTLAGYYILKEISAVSEFAVGARWHHERFDGSGYPNGLSGENIPLIARVIGVADAYDAMTSNRSYRNFMPQHKVRQEIERGAGKQFDPTIAAILLEMIDEDKDYRLHQPEELGQRLVLAIDDDPTVLRLMELALEEKPQLRLLTANSGERGLEILRKKKIDLVLLDVEMPEMDGFEVLAQIRNDDKTLPVIFMTGDKEMEIIQKAEIMGISDYLTKPVVAHMLYESIQNVLSHIPL